MSEGGTIIVCHGDLIEDYGKLVQEAALEKKIIDLYSKGIEMQLFPIAGSKGESFLYEYTKKGVRPSDPLLMADLPDPGYITLEKFKELVKEAELI